MSSKKVVIFKNEDGTQSVLVPTEQALKIMSIEEIAKKDVPPGIPFEIVNAEDIEPERNN